MEQQFKFSLTEAEKDYLLLLVRRSILAGLKERGEKAESSGLPKLAPHPPSERLKEKFGAFVTLKINGGLRGCIGRVVGDLPLVETVSRMARSAAFEDPRFPPLSAGEFPRLEIEISILSPLTPCPDSDKIEVGRHGLLISKGGASGLLLPQVPVEWGWDRETFLAQCCRKAGLPSSAWKDQDARIFWFEAEVFD